MNKPNSNEPGTQRQRSPREYQRAGNKDGGVIGNNFKERIKRMNECGSVCEVDRQTQCTKAADRLSGSINVTDDLLGKLEHKLCSVLMPSCPAVPGCEKSKEPESLVPLASELNHQDRRIMSLNDVIRSILDRLEN